MTERFEERGGATSRETRTLFVVLRRYWWFILLVTTLAVAGTFLLTQRQERIYQATATVLLRTSESAFLFPFSESAPSSFFRNDVAERLYAETPAFREEVGEAAPSGVRVSISTATPRLRFNARGPSPASVAEAANTWAETYVASRQADIEQTTSEELQFLGESVLELEGELAVLRVDLDRFDELLEATEDADEYGRLLTQRVALENLLAPKLAPLEQELANLRSDESRLKQRTRFFDPEVSARVERQASVPTKPVSPNVTRNLLLGGALGLLLGTVLPFGRITAAGRIESRDEVKESTAFTTLANIPRYKPDADTTIEVLDNPASVPSAQYQALLTAIEFKARDQPIDHIMVTSAVSGDGKSTVSLNLAALAAQYLNVLLVDGDMRRPDLAERLEVSDDVGLVDVLKGLSVSEARQTVRRDGATFDVLTAGSAKVEPALLLRGSRWPEVIDDLFLYDLVIVDAPPVLAVTDGLLLGAPLDAQILVTRTSGTRRDDLAEAAELIGRNQTRTLGVVVNQESRRRAHYTYYGSD